MGLIKSILHPVVWENGEDEERGYSLYFVLSDFWQFIFRIALQESRVEVGVEWLHSQESDSCMTWDTRAIIISAVFFWFSLEICRGENIAPGAK
jgi:hypothetical protein